MLSNMYGPTRFLVDSDYRRLGASLITPFVDQQVQPASYDVTLATTLLLPKEAPVYGTAPHQHLGLVPRMDLRGMKPADLMYPYDMPELGFQLTPGKSVLGATREHVTCPTDMVCSVDGKSTLGRCWISIHATAGFIDPGFTGIVTLEITNHGPWTFVIYPGMPIGQLRFAWLGKEVDKPYGSPGLGSHYQGATNVAAAEPLETK